MASSSFQRKVKTKLPDIVGVSPSLLTNQLLTSSGVPDLDSLIGGGLAVGTVLVVVEDVSGNYSRLLLKYFLSEGLVHDHSLIVSNSSPDNKLVTHSLPSIELNTQTSSSTTALDQTNSSTDEQMKIAWRYQGQNSTKSSNVNTAQSSHHFNLLKTVPSEDLEKRDITVCYIDLDCDAGTDWKNSEYDKLMKNIKNKAESGGFIIDPSRPGDNKSVLRIGVQSVGSAVWGGLETQTSHVSRFLFSLRSLLRSCFSVAVVTIPSHMFDNQVIRDCVLLLSDYCVSLQSWEGGDEKVNDVYKDYHGLLDILKIQSLGSFTVPNNLIQEPGHLVFKSKRTKFVIEQFHLPPDLSEVVSRDNKDKAVKSHNIDF